MKLEQRPAGAQGFNHTGSGKKCISGRGGSSELENPEARVCLGMGGEI